MRNVAIAMLCAALAALGCGGVVNEGSGGGGSEGSDPAPHAPTCAPASPPCAQGESLGTSELGHCSIEVWACPGGDVLVAARACDVLQQPMPTDSAAAAQLESFCAE